MATKLEKTSLSVQVYIRTKCVLRFGNGVRLRVTIGNTMVTKLEKTSLSVQVYVLTRLVKTSPSENSISQVRLLWGKTVQYFYVYR